MILPSLFTSKNPLKLPQKVSNYHSRTTTTTPPFFRFHYAGTAGQKWLSVLVGFGQVPPPWVIGMTLIHI